MVEWWLIGMATTIEISTLDYSGRILWEGLCHNDKKVLDALKTNTTIKVLCRYLPPPLYFGPPHLLHHCIPREYSTAPVLQVVDNKRACLNSSMMIGGSCGGGWWIGG